MRASTPGNGARRHRRAADVAGGLQHQDAVTGARQQRRGDQAVVAGADHDDVRRACGCGHSS